MIIYNIDKYFREGINALKGVAATTLGAKH
jgi:hypothetical protein